MKQWYSNLNKYQKIFLFAASLPWPIPFSEFGDLGGFIGLIPLLILIYLQLGQMGKKA